MNIDNKDYTLVAQNLAHELISDITGENEEWLFGKIPSENVMIGMIDGAKKESSILKGDDVDNKRLESIPSIGLRFKIDKNSDHFEFSLKGKLFYRVIPTYEQQCRYLLEKYSKKEGKNFVTISDLKEFLENRGRDETEKEKIAYVYKSISLPKFGDFSVNISNCNESIKLINEEIANKIQEEIDLIRNESCGIKNVSRKISTFFNEDSYNNLLKSSCFNVVPIWQIELYCSITEYEKYNEIVLQLINTTNKTEKTGTYETAIFNGGLIIKSNSPFLHYDFNAIKHYYADKATIPAIGNNCTVVEDGLTLSTENIPIFEQKRVVTIDKFNSYVEFDKLINNPIENLEFISKEMKKKLKQYENDLLDAKSKYDDDYIDRFSREIEDFKFEINRYNYGIELLKTKANDVRQSFILMNETFALNKKYTGWRMFQIVFIVSEIADLINCEYHNTPGFYCNDINSVDLIYFPTGGGKTETFLGCVIFSAFFDRIRGKHNGVTSIIKYPLRLLAAQQLDRVLLLTINANKIKKAHNLEGDDFSVGFFTGSKNTPNKIDDKKRLEIESMPDDTRNSFYRQIDYCPICGSEMNVFFDESSWCLKHKCSNTKCGFVPPIYIVDDEIYRFSPTTVISTIDKMANIGTSMGFKSLLGQTKNRCAKHGFVTYGNRCSVSKCNCEIEYDVERKDPAPTLVIQDEMHLVNESLGTFDSHYESLIQYYCSSLVPKEDRKLIKFIGATATISDYEKHIKGLYNKDAKQFPTSVKKENFYSRVDNDDICRIIIGAALYGGSITDRIQQLVTIMRIIVSNWFIDSKNKLIYLKKQGFQAGEEELKQILQHYLISIIYNNSKNDAGTIRAILENQGSNTLSSENIKDFNIAEISGDVEFKTIKSVMHNVESDPDKYNTKNVIIATSAISHGVDEDCFNQIYFFGMPNQTSEYIQAYSRVGRKHTGLVFDVFRIIRDRDKSYLKNFYNFHEYKDLLIDPVPINRYAKNAIYSTLPGIISALIYQIYVQKYKAIDVTKAINDGTFTLEKLIDDIKNIYDCDSSDSKLYEDIIIKETTSIFNAFKSNTNSEINVADLIKNSNSKHKGPMTNLRDVDVPLDIYMKEE